MIVALASDIRAAVADRLVFESYVGTRPADAERIAVLVHSVFDRRGFIADLPTLTRLLHEHAYRPGVVAPKFEEVLRNDARSGENDFTGGKFKKAAEELGKLIIAMRQNSLVLTRDPKNRELALRTMVFYALACGRLAKAKGVMPAEAEKFTRLRDETMVEVIRSFPSKIITAKAFGEEAEELFLTLRDQLNKTGRGGLSISVSDLDAVIYINEIVYGTAKVDVGDLLPGIYRVLLQMSTGEARQYEIEVTAKQVSRLAVDWDVDSLLVVGDWVGFKYPTEKEHAREAQLVRQLAQKRSNADVAATVTITHVHGRPAVIGTTYAVASGKLLQSGRVEIAGTISDETTLDHLVDYMMDHADAEGVTPVEHPEYTPPPPDPAPEIEDTRASAEPPPPTTAAVPATTSNRLAPAEATTPRTWPRWAAANGAAVMLAAGSYALYKHYAPCGFGIQGEDCKTYYKYAEADGYTAIGIGVALSVLATYWFIRDADNPRPRVTVAPSRSSAVIGWATEF